MMNYHDYKSCIDSCLKCAAICNYCASACLQEKDVTMMARCAELDMQCATACYSAAQMMSLGNDRADEYCRICADICRECADECSRHEQEHCQQCAKACRECAEECAMMAEAV
jgi:glucosamine 6-phosphate synthetase-like amidotransferase/phosphosugar isomerase protein